MLRFVWLVRVGVHRDGFPTLAALQAQHVVVRPAREQVVAQVGCMLPWREEVWNEWRSGVSGGVE